MKNTCTTLALAALTALPAAATAAEYVVGQKDKAFTMEEMKIRVGDVVRFENNDPFFHNVFSLSNTKTFDLGSYPAGESRAVTFDKPGTVEVECAIHGDMYLVIEVSE